MEHFIHCIKTRDNPISDGMSALTVIHVGVTLALNS